jgi:hypothetical protein
MWDGKDHDEPAGAFRPSPPPHELDESPHTAHLLIEELSRRPPSIPLAYPHTAAYPGPSADPLDESTTGTTLAPASMQVPPRHGARFWPWALAAMLLGGAAAIVAKRQMQPPAPRWVAAATLSPLGTHHEARLPAPAASSAAASAARQLEGPRASRAEATAPLDATASERTTLQPAAAEQAPAVPAAAEPAAAEPASEEPAAVEEAAAEEADEADVVEPSAPAPTPHHNPLRDPYHAD